MNFPPNSLLKNRWKILSKIGQGAFGEAYIAEDIISRNKVAIKTESADKKKQMLKSEVSILKTLQGAKHICEYYGCGRHQGFNFIVMELLGQNLSQLRRSQHNHKFPLGVTCLLALDMLNAIETLHNNGIIHRDVKPSNFALGLKLEPGNKKPNVHIIDFGLSRKYKTKDGELTEARKVAGFRGTARYASVNSHFSMDLSRRDDIWSLFYLIVEFMLGNLPWRKEKNRDVIGKMKQEMTNITLLKDLPLQMQHFLHHISDLSFKDQPNYELLRSLLKTMYENSKDNTESFFAGIDLSATLTYSKYLSNVREDSNETISADILPVSVHQDDSSSHTSEEKEQSEMNIHEQFMQDDLFQAGDLPEKTEIGYLYDQTLSLERLHQLEKQAQKKVAPKLRRNSKPKEKKSKSRASSPNRTQTFAFSSRNTSEEEKVLSSLFDLATSTSPTRPNKKTKVKTPFETNHVFMQEDLTNDVRYVAPPSLNSKMDDYNMNLETEVSVESIFRTGEEVSQLDKKWKQQNESFIEIE